jgi:multicomponent Na+:H+ antiporter subunit A
MFLILIGAFTKSAQFPFSIWLPAAMEAPTPVSAYLHSATMVKAGIYLVARCTIIFGGTPEWFWLVSGIGLITLLYGSINALKQNDLKALLAYSTISQLGLIMTLLGLGSAALHFVSAPQGAIYSIAIFAAIFHLFNHSTFKGCLFMVVGIIDHELGTRDIRRLGGLLHLMPVSFVLTLTGSLAMAGLPPFNGFLSKELFFTALINAAQMPVFNMPYWGTIVAFLAWFASVLTFVYCLTILLKTFMGRAKGHKLKKKPREASMGMLISPFILATLVIGIFFYHQGFSQHLFIPAWEAVLPTLAGSMHVEVKAWHGFSAELLMTLGVIGFGIMLYITRSKWLRIYNYYPLGLTLNNLYELLMEKLEGVSLAIIKGFMTGSVRHYLLYILTFIILVMGAAMLLFEGMSFDPSRDAVVSFYELALLLGMIATAVTVLLARTRLTAVIATGALGFLVVFVFVLFRAPDLALTQLVVETVTTVLFLLCFYHLPQLRKESIPTGSRVINAVVSVGVGMIVAVVAFSANGRRLFAPISSYYENAYELAKAKNIVNAILVDFRGFDTMLEILVLTLAGLGVYTLIKLRLAGGKKDEAA